MTSANRPLSDRVDLAHVEDFALATLTIRPSVRQVISRDGTSEVVEPRVMQVLVALCRASGAIVTRDELTASCWEGRVVGEDAINRVISRLRRVGHEVGADSFQIETITKVGYRLLIGTDDEGHAGEAPAVGVPRALQTSRRGIIVGALGLGTTVVVGGVLWQRLTQRTTVPTRVTMLVTQADLALQQDSAEGNAQAVGIYRRVVDLEPEFADGWGGLAFAYATSAHQAPADLVDQMRIRAREAADRAIALEPGNAYAQAALAVSLPSRGNWLKVERATRRASDDHPNNPRLLFVLGQTLIEVGRLEEAAALITRATAIGPPSPISLYKRTEALWSIDRLNDADRSSDEMFALYPRHIGVWFGRFYLFLFTGRVNDALAMLDTRETRPPGIPDSDFDIVRAGALAVKSGEGTDIDHAMRLHMDAARKGFGYAMNAMGFASFLGRLDVAFLLADAMYFGQPFEPGELFFSEQQGTYVARGDQLTGQLFKPTASKMRLDQRFDPLMRRLGIAHYWQVSGVLPDYRQRARS